MKKIVVSLFILALSFALAGCGDDGYADYLKTAKQNYRLGNFPTAKQQFEEIAKKAEDADIRGQANQALNNYDAKVAAFKKASPTFMEEYNTAMSSNWSFLYAGCSSSRNFYDLTVRVQPFWYSLNKDQKENFIYSAVKMYRGMWKLRDVDIDMDYMDIYFKDTNGAIVGSWGSIRGANVKK